MNTEYLTYSVEDLTQDDHFIQWIKAGRPSGDWMDLSNSNPDFADKVNAAGQLVEAIQFKSIPAEWNTEALWNRINTSIDHKTTAEKAQKTKVVSMTRRSYLLRMAYATAAAMAGIIAFQIWMTGEQDIYAPIGGRLAHVLPDQSSVQLNADSKIAYDKNAWDDKRTLTLDGEAFFDVQKGETFTVKTTRGSVTVLGTSFNVYARQDGFRVHCKSGRVEVRSGNDVVILSPEDQVYLINGNLELEKEKIAVPVGWLEGKYEYTDAPLSSVFEELERQFNVTIHAEESINKRKFNGTFSSENLSNVLDDVCFSMKLQADVQGKTINIKAAGE